MSTYIWCVLQLHVFSVGNRDFEWEQQRITSWRQTDAFLAVSCFTDWFHVNKITQSNTTITLRHSLKQNHEHNLRPFWLSLVQFYPHMNTFKHPLAPQRFVVFATSALHYESVYPFFLTLKSVCADYTTQDKRLIKDGRPVLSCRVGGDDSLQRDRRERASRKRVWSLCVCWQGRCVKQEAD